MLEARLTGINRNEVLKYLGYKGGSLPSDIELEINRCANEIISICRPRVVYRIFDILPDGSFDRTGFRPEGRDVRLLLSDCRRAVLFGATLGTEAESLVRRRQIKDMSEALILDCCGSSAIENVCDNFCSDLQEEFSFQYLTDRFSPGYGDMPFSQQKSIINILDMPRRIGVTCTESGLMIPQKSVTGLIGIADSPQPRRFRGCEHCNNFRNCAFRKENTFCGKE